MLRACVARHVKLTPHYLRLIVRYYRKRVLSLFSPHNNMRTTAYLLLAMTTNLEERHLDGCRPAVREVPWRVTVAAPRRLYRGDNQVTEARPLRPA